MFCFVCLSSYLEEIDVTNLQSSISRNVSLLTIVKTSTQRPPLDLKKIGLDGGVVTVLR